MAILNFIAGVQGTQGHLDPWRMVHFPIKAGIVHKWKRCPGDMGWPLPIMAGYTQRTFLMQHRDTEENEMPHWPCRY